MKNKYQLAIVALASVMCFNVALASTFRNPIKLKRAKYRVVKKLSRSLADTKIKNVEFAFNKEEVSPRYYSELDNVAKLMSGNNASLRVSGYADNKGGYVYNWKLSEKRAKMVKTYLASKGADTSRIAVTEFGYTHPIASNKTAAGRKKNRRVEMHFTE